MISTPYLAIGFLTLALGGCGLERPVTVGQQSIEPPLQLRERVGQKVTVRGRFSLRGKEGPFVVVGETPVYLVARAPFSWGEPYVSMEDRTVTVTGLLRRLEPPVAKHLPDTVQQSPPHFFFEMRDTTISMVR